jgi:formylglycine-generating enzyme required for sulfatase activity
LLIEDLKGEPFTDMKPVSRSRATVGRSALAVDPPRDGHTPKLPPRAARRVGQGYSMRFSLRRHRGDELSTQSRCVSALLVALVASGCIGESAVRSGARAAAVSEDAAMRDIVSDEGADRDVLSRENPYSFKDVSTDTMAPDGADAAPRGEDAAADGATRDDAPDAEPDAAVTAGEDATSGNEPMWSCRAGLLCGRTASRGSCCESLAVPAGVVLMGRSVDGVDQAPVPNPEELPEHPMSVPAFSLDRYEVTVGRYRAYLDAWSGRPIAEGAGANAAIPASGWQPAWNDHLAQSRDEARRRLHCAAGDESWTDAPGPNEERPMGCLNWYEAFAFCIWDGGRLATEAEWERAAAGGEENRLFPWGNAEPDCAHVAPWHFCREMSDAFSPVGTHPQGRGRWGHEDLAGSAEEWTLDHWGYYREPYPPAALTPEYPVDNPRSLRGLSFYGGMGDMRAADRGTAPPDSRYVRFGVRCAHDVARP